MKSERDSRIGPQRLHQDAPNRDRAAVEARSDLPVAWQESLEVSADTRRPRYLALRSVRKITFLTIADIVWVDALRNYVRLHGADGTTHMAREQLCDIEQRLAPEGFLRIHRSTIINLEFVREVEITRRGSYVAILRSGQRLNVSRSYHAALFALLDSH